MEKENINNTIEEDLNRRNRNWDKISALISDVDNLISYVGDLETLTTDEKSNIVGALNEIDSNIKSHLAESASKHITESGSNTNGRYIRFDDGTQICWMRNVVLERMSEKLLGTNHPFPSAFVNAEVSITGTFSSSANMYEGNVSYDIVQGLKVYTLNAVNAPLRCYLVRGAPALDEGSKITVPCVIAVGRWK